MFRHILIALTLLIVAAPAADGQSRNQGSDSDPGPVRALLELRSELALTDEQVGRLRAIDAEMHRKNEPSVTQLMAVRSDIRRLGRRRDMTPEQREQYEGYLRQARPLMKQIRDNNHAAMKQVGGVLNDVQKRQLSELLKRDDDEKRGDTRDTPRPR